ncbi:hypothetical protein LL06_20735 [Hoeflea sp. BAL378]|uniref:glycosyltransferase n=1 Tax=Hoeflea sp. BAL378 TaxID=1547437 RepID=UPI0005130F05|nr:glycosyltransferase [Hoeflea sp. BAL378]KGF67691.1 hypothetical protein LL06_20735 [Hoeflea sp. BAL378]
MKIVMFTNTFTPHVGGVARSVSELAEGLRRAGDEVLVVAPDFDHMPDHEEGVIRVAAVQNFAGSDFSVPLPLSLNLSSLIEDFNPDIIHSHHPFLLGDTALRAASSLDVPVVFTHHTRYELYGHYVAQDSALLKRLALSLSLGYCEMCDGVIAPSQSIASFLQDHHVRATIAVIPTGVITAQFRNGAGALARRRLAIPDTAVVVGHVGRLAPEKNLDYLASALAIFLNRNPDAHGLIVGDGPSRPAMMQIFASAGIGGRVHFTGVLRGAELADAYAAMNVFAFASFSETQGLVLIEAMTAGVPVVALDAPGAREVVASGQNGRLLAADADATLMAAALSDLTAAPARAYKALCEGARGTAEAFAIDKTVARTRDFYLQTLRKRSPAGGGSGGVWLRAKRAIARELDIVGNIAHAASESMFPESDESGDKD